MRKIDANELDELLEEFLTANPVPSANDWKHLIDEHPKFAGAIADAALVRQGRINLDEKGAIESDGSDLFNATISQVINLVYNIPSPLLEEAKSRVEAVKGPAVKRVAQDIGLGPYPALLNGVLVGRTTAPKRILKALEAVLQVPVSALVALFGQTFLETEMPAYKASGVKPKVPLRPASWEDAVKSLNLPEGETTRLLKFAQADHDL
jgi:hypothetical protein